VTDPVADAWLLGILRNDTVPSGCHLERRRPSWTLRTSPICCAEFGSIGTWPGRRSVTRRGARIISSWGIIKVGFWLSGVHGRLKSEPPGI